MSKEEWAECWRLVSQFVVSLTIEQRIIVGSGATAVLLPIGGALVWLALHYGDAAHQREMSRLERERESLQLKLELAHSATQATGDYTQVLPKFERSGMLVMARLSKALGEVKDADEAGQLEEIRDEFELAHQHVMELMRAGNDPATILAIEKATNLLDQDVVLRNADGLHRIYKNKPVGSNFLTVIRYETVDKDFKTTAGLYVSPLADGNAQIKRMLATLQSQVDVVEPSNLTTVGLPSPDLLPVPEPLP